MDLQALVKALREQQEVVLSQAKAQAQLLGLVAEVLQDLEK
jgi:hypothetical protein